MAWVKVAHIKGPKGATGAKGHTGARGPGGDRGHPGARGGAGARGPGGNRGGTGHISAAQGDRYYALKAHHHTAAQMRPTKFNGIFIFPTGLSVGRDLRQQSSQLNINRVGAAAGGYLEVHWGQVAHVASARKHKKNIVDMDRRAALDAVKRIPVRAFTFINDEGHVPQLGVIAEEMTDTYPDLILTDEEDGPVEGFRYVGLIPDLVATAQLLLDRIDVLEAR